MVQNRIKDFWLGLVSFVQVRGGLGRVGGPGAFHRPVGPTLTVGGSISSSCGRSRWLAFRAGVGADGRGVAARGHRGSWSEDDGVLGGEGGREGVMRGVAGFGVTPLDFCWVWKRGNGEMRVMMLVCVTRVGRSCVVYRSNEML